MRLKQVEEKLQKIIDKYNVTDKLTIEMIKNWIYNERGNPMQAVHDFQDKCFSYFEAASEENEDLNEILQVITEAWNYFPHKSLGDKSPFEITRK